MKGGGAFDWGAFVPLTVHPTKVGAPRQLYDFTDQVRGGEYECSAKVTD